MKRLDDDSIVISNEEAAQLYEILRHFMSREWDHHTDRVIETQSEESGMEYLNPDAYRIANELSTI